MKLHLHILKVLKALFVLTWNKSTGGLTFPKMPLTSWVKVYAFGIFFLGILSVGFHFILELYVKRPLATILFLILFAVVLRLIVEPAMDKYFLKALKRKIEKE